MIVRNVAVRQGRTAAVAAPLAAAARTCFRALSTDSTTSSSSSNGSAPPMTPLPPKTPTATTTPPAAAAAAAAAVPRVLDPKLQARFGAVKPTGPDTVAQDFIAAQRQQKRSRNIGGSVDRNYIPGAILKDPPYPKDVTLELLMASQCHMGHNASLWNPANSRYIYGVRQGIHVISLEQTAAHLRRAARLVEEVAFHGGLILFAGTRKGQMDSVVRAAELAGACHLFSRWTPGTITNRDQLLAGTRVKMVDEHDNEVREPGWEQHVQDRRPLVPDLVVCLNPLENFVLLHECTVSNIPTVGIIDTNADPTKVTYPIPANDDSLRATNLIAGVLGRAGELGQRRRKEAAKLGQVTWQNPVDVARFMRSKMADKALETDSRKEMESDLEKEKKLMDALAGDAAALEL